MPVMADVTVASRVPFYYLAHACEKIENCEKKDPKLDVLGRIFEKWRKIHTNLHGDNKTDDSFYPAMRLLLPHCDRDRGPYGIKQSTLARHYINILQLSNQSEDAQALLKYKVPAKSRAAAGDFASVAYAVVRKRRDPQETGELSVAEVNHYLDAVALNGSMKKNEEVRKHLFQLLRKTTALEQKWLIRIILREMKFGISETSVLKKFHPGAEELYKVQSSLLKVCSTLKGGVSLFIAVHPMASKRCIIVQILKSMGQRIFYIETKYDGERMQLHKQGNKFMYFSRNCYDFTEGYGADSTKGNLTQFIAHTFNPKVQECILDGEMMGFSTKTKSFGSKGKNFDVKTLRLDGEYQPCYCVFDILFYNGQDLTSTPLKERLKYLDGLFVPVEGRIQLTVDKPARSKQDIIEALNLAIDEREEGIMIKDPESVYLPSSRNGGWFKLKPDYINGLLDTLDLVIIGGYYGVAQVISRFLLAVAVPPGSARKGDYPSEFHSVARVGSGNSDEELIDLLGKLQPHFRNRQPAGVVVANVLKEKPDVYIEPSMSQIVEVKATEIIQSSQFRTGWTLRFPRVVKVRYDKLWHECMTTTEFEELQKKGKLVSGHATMDDAEEPAKKKRRGGGARRTEQPIAVARELLGIDPSEVAKVSELLKGKEFYVAPGSAVARPKCELETLVVEHGGTLVQNPGASTFCVLADQKKARVTNIISSNKYDVVKSDWLLRCLDRRQLLSWAPSDMLHAKPETTKTLAEAYDCFGDSYVEKTTPEALRKVFESMQIMTLMQQDIATIEEKYFEGASSPLGLFRCCEVYLDTCLIVGDQTTRFPFSPLDITEMDLRYRGATVSEKLHERVTHVIVHPSDLSRVEEIHRFNSERNRKFHLVTKEWVSESIQKLNLQTEGMFELNV